MKLLVTLLCCCYATEQGNCSTFVHSEPDSITENGQLSTSDYCFQILLYCWLLLMFIFIHFL
jgi:hypothetical protein